MTYLPKFLTEADLEMIEVVNPWRGEVALAFSPESSTEDVLYCALIYRDTQEVREQVVPWNRIKFTKTWRERTARRMVARDTDTQTPFTLLA